MKWLLLFTIRLYWTVSFGSRQRRCLFKESCSHYVYRIAAKFGLVPGLKALVSRFRTCRPGYRVTADESGLRILLVDGTTIPPHEASKVVLESCREVAHLLELSLQRDARDRDLSSFNVRGGVSAR
jgi:uncharacterized protein